MPRGRKVIKKRQAIPDPVYKNLLLGKFINRMMYSGKKTVAQKEMYEAMELLKKQELDPINVFETALSNVGPKVEVRPKRIGGAAYQVPVEVRGERKVSLAIRWILEAARKRSNKDHHTFAQKLAAEFLDASKNSGEAIRKRDTAFKMAEANKAFAHFRW